MKYGRDFRLWFSWNNQPAPWILFVPLAEATVIDAPPAMPCSASNEDVVMLTFSTVSAGATYATWCGSQMLILIAPSRRVTLLFVAVPFTNVRSARPGVSVGEFWKVEGVAPGTRLINAW